MQAKKSGRSRSAEYLRDLECPRVIRWWIFGVRCSVGAAIVNLGHSRSDLIDEYGPGSPRGSEGT